MADFNTKEEKSRIDIVFLAIFFTLLFIPMSNINQEKKSKYENRFLATYKPLLTKEGKINFNFGKDYNNWFSDRFNFRNELVLFYNSALVAIAGKNDKGIVDKKSGFFYLYSDFEHLEKDIIKDNFATLFKFNDFCKQNNIKLYVLIVPQKGDIYKTNKSHILAANKNDEFVKYLKEINKEDLTTIYPLDAMAKKSQDDYMFFKTEHHWTDDGAFAGYQELMKEIKKDFQDVNILNKEDFNYSYNTGVRSDFNRKYALCGTTIELLGLPCSEKYRTTKYKYYTHKESEKLKQELVVSDYLREKIYYYPNGANKKVILFGTSQGENLTEFIPFTFKYVKRIRSNGVKKIKKADQFKIMKYYKQEILDYKPDIIIFCINRYTNILFLHTIFDKD